MVRVDLVKISRNIYLLRLSDDETRFFEGLWSIPEGVTYNAYLATLPESVVLFDGWKTQYSDLFVDTVLRVVDVKDVKYVVVHHMEPDHSGSLLRVLRSNNEVMVLGHPLVAGLIESFYGLKPRFKPINDGDAVDLGVGYVLRFYHTPWLHWPDTVVSYLENENVLFTCDIFGSYGIPTAVFYEDLPEREKSAFKWYTQKYFANIIGKYADWVPRNLSKLLGLNLKINVVATGHGPLYRGVGYIADYYMYLGSKSTRRGKVVVLYTSMYRFVEKAVEIVVNELEKRGINPSVYKYTDTYRDQESDIVGDVYDAEGIILATATYDADVFPITKYLVELLLAKVPRGKKVLILASYGWGPVAGKKLEKVFKEGGFSPVGVVEFRGSPAMDEAKIREAVAVFLEHMETR